VAPTRHHRADTTGQNRSTAVPTFSFGCLFHSGVGRRPSPAGPPPFNSNLLSSRLNASSSGANLVKLRAMAQRARALAHDVPDDVMSARLLEIAAELEAQEILTCLYRRRRATLTAHWSVRCSGSERP
jgi:hypothetical protein